MRKRSKSQSASKAFGRAHLFGPPPILEGEDAKAYDEILDRVFGAVGPTDFIEEIWVRDLADVTWAMFRWRRILAALISEQVCENQKLWPSNNIDLIQGRVLRDRLDMIERIDNLIAMAQRRIDEVIRELDRHRFMRLQLNSFQDRQGSKLETVEPKMIEGKALNKKVA